MCWLLCVLFASGLADGDAEQTQTMGDAGMYEQYELAPQVRKWREQGLWNDLGDWRRASNGALEYHPTPEEIAAKCELFRQIDGWRGANKRAPRGGEYAVMETKGL
jgi:hypothetical protein